MQRPGISWNSPVTLAASAALALTSRLSIFLTSLTSGTAAEARGSPGVS
jgi:hypothetical protein